LDDERPDLSGNRPHNICWQTHSIVRNDDSITILTLAQAFDGDDTTASSTEGMLKGVGEELIPLLKKVPSRAGGDHIHLRLAHTGNMAS
jgi:hypothetical protein